MAVVNTNISASLAQASLARNERALSKAMEQLSSGKNINTAADDAPVWRSVPACLHRLWAWSSRYRMPQTRLA